MSKTEKNIQIFETEKMINGKVVLELTTKKAKLGMIELGDSRYIAIYPNGERFRASSQDEAVNLLIRNFHLHLS
ncbi:DUF2969 domain-containing protein [Ligilactobacillus sp. WILCCON 0076]|uniref:DUF2969 domain-containing protein n=1 Tax=Ligilactobacillus ubinensis TaxID=2876789 RepID=A0A9X2FGH7_9LACO|nr:DUF2969 domain-containing protein [Ligilactobacillus ubinensis]MCP0885949.1 DUF2969 domain-containing protein [Ligilactobacillus ubinensis]